MSKTHANNQLEDQLKQLEWEVEPSRDLWPDISSRIRFQDRSNNKLASAKQPWLPFAIAASCILAIASILFSSFSLHNSRVNQLNQETALMFQQAQLDLIQEQHTLIRSQFTMLVNDHSDEPKPRFVTEVNQLIEDVDSASVEIIEAIKSQPNNTDYMKMLINLYQHELKLLNRIKADQSQQINSVSETHI